MTLTIDDFVNSMFDSRTPRKTMVTSRDDYRRKEPAIEGVTTTDNYNTIGYTYFLKDGMLHLNCLDAETRKNLRLLEKEINTYADFDKALKLADKIIYRKKISTISF